MSAWCGLPLQHCQLAERWALDCVLCVRCMLGVCTQACLSICSVAAGGGRLVGWPSVDLAASPALSRCPCSSGLLPSSSTRSSSRWSCGCSGEPAALRMSLLPYTWRWFLAAPCGSRARVVAAQCGVPVLQRAGAARLLSAGLQLMLCTLCCAMRCAGSTWWPSAGASSSSCRCGQRALWACLGLFWLQPYSHLGALVACSCTRSAA